MGQIPTWNPDLYVHILALSLSAALAQIFILITIRDYGALLFATVMTTRQFLSILLSCLIFMHPLSLGQ
ncbi:UAA transporter, partial [Baffinella frigidus]